MGNSLERQANCRGGEIGRPPVYKREMVFESLKSTEVDEYGTTAGSNPALGSVYTFIDNIDYDIQILL